jgi:hypothetical protein
VLALLLNLRMQASPSCVVLKKYYEDSDQVFGALSEFLWCHIKQFLIFGWVIVLTQVHFHIYYLFIGIHLESSASKTFLQSNLVVTYPSVSGKVWVALTLYPRRNPKIYPK